jgi:hypothetical protein
MAVTMNQIYEAEKMTVEVMESMLNCAYNDITFKNALVCALDWCNYQHCANIHKDTKIAIDADGYRIDHFNSVGNKIYIATLDNSIVDDKEYFRKKDNGKYVLVEHSDIDETKKPIKTNSGKKLYEYNNPSANNWYEHVTSVYHYVEIPKKDYTYYTYPRDNGWYYYSNGQFWPTLDIHATGTYQVITNVTSSDNPEQMGWYEEADVSGGYLPTYDKTPVEGKTYYECLYIQYYKRVEESVSEYILSSDTIVDPTKSYFYTKDVVEYKEMPDWTDHYERRVDITIPGIENEITLQNKRPAHYGG